MATPGLTQEELKEWLDYNPETGAFSRKKYASKKYGCGTIDEHGYMQISVKHKVYRAHRLAWLWVYGKFPEKIIDHINGNKLDNRICNLRDVCKSVNGLNVNKYKGFHKHQNKFRSRIKVFGKTIDLGVFDTPEQARNAYLAEKQKHIGVSHGNQ